MHTAELDWITPDAERVVARHARVSTADPDRAEFEKLLKYCILHGHWSIYEQASASFEIITTRSISAQIIRHRSFAFQETSQRYCDPTSILAEAEKECWDFELRRQDEKNRQNSTPDLDPTLAEAFKERIEILYTDLKNTYQDMLEAGVAKECARNILPMCSPTRLHMSGSIRSWIHYVGLRAAVETQLEHREVALAIGRKLESEIPVIVSAVKEHAKREFNLKGWLNV
jgi:thymidylate synthase (FAD)